MVVMVKRRSIDLLGGISLAYQGGREGFGDKLQVFIKTLI
jgi:hypothetical protein